MYIYCALLSGLYPRLRDSCWDKRFSHIYCPTVLSRICHIYHFDPKCNSHSLLLFWLLFYFFSTSNIRSLPIPHVIFKSPSWLSTIIIIVVLVVVLVVKVCWLLTFLNKKEKEGLLIYNHHYVFHKTRSYNV